MTSMYKISYVSECENVKNVPQDYLLELLKARPSYFPLCNHFLLTIHGLHFLTVTREYNKWVQTENLRR